MICAQCHSLRDIVEPGYHRRRGLLRLTSSRSSSTDRARNPIRPTGPTGARAAFRTTRSASGRASASCAAARRARAAIAIRTCPTSTRTRSSAPASDALCIGCHKAIGAARRRAHAASCRQRGQLLRRVPHAADRAEHQGDASAITRSACRRRRTRCAFAIPNACNECHADKQASWAVDTLARWWPRRTPREAGRRAPKRSPADARGRPEALGSADRDREGRAVRARSIQANAVGYLRTTRPARARRAGLPRPRRTHPLMRSAALSGLGVVAGDPAVRRSTLLAALDDPKRAVRMAALTGLINQGGGPPEGDDCARFRRVSLEFAARARSHEDDAAMQRDLGVDADAGRRSRSGGRRSSDRASDWRPIGRRSGSCWGWSGSASAASTKR